MRVMITTASHDAVWDRTLGLAVALRGAGHDVVLAHTGPQPSAEQAFACQDAGVKMEHRPYGLEWLDGGLADQVRCRAWLAQVADQHRVDIVHCVAFSHVVADRPCVLSPHATWDGRAAAIGADAPPAAYRETVRRALSEATVVCAPTPSQAKEIASCYGGLVPEVIAAGVAAQRRFPNRRPYILAGGHVADPANGMDILDEAAAGLPWPALATGTVRSAHADRFRRLQPTGHLPRKALQRLQRGAGLYVDPARYVRSGIGPLQAASWGTPLVLSDLPAHRDVWQDAATFVPPGDAGALHDALRRLLDDPDERARLGKAAWARARTATLEHMALAHEALYKRCSLVLA